MPSAVTLREDYSAEELRALARRSKDANQSRRLLSLAAVRDGMDRGSAAKVGGMDRQTLRDWVHRFNAAGPEGLIDNWTEGPKPRLSAGQLADFAAIVEAGPDRERDGIVRWRRADLKRIIAERFGVDFHERYVGKLLKKLGFSHMRATMHLTNRTGFPIMTVRDRPADISERDIEEIISPAMERAGADRLADIGEASVTYLAVEAFVAMVGAACLEQSPLGKSLRHEILSRSKTS